MTSPEAAKKPTPTVRKGQGPGHLSREVFRQRFERGLDVDLFRDDRAAYDAVEELAWQAYDKSKKAPRLERAGDVKRAGLPVFQDADYQLSRDWLDAAAAIAEAQREHDDPASSSRVLVIIGGARNDKTCPGEASKTWRLANIVEGVVAAAAGFDADVLDLSLLSSEYGRHIHPCKGCLSTAMPLCHWPCSCYPNAALGQTNDWMNELYPRFARAHAVIVVTPVYWHQAPGGLKTLIDRLVCADGGNRDPTSTSGKDPAKAKALELSGWNYPQHLAGRAYGVVVHGDVSGIESLRHALCGWLDGMGLVDSGSMARLDRFIGYFGSYAESHEHLDDDVALQREVENAALAVVATVTALRSGQLVPPERVLKDPRPK